MKSLNKFNISKSQPKRDQMSGRVPCRHVTPIANAPWKHLEILGILREKNKVKVKKASVSIEDVTVYIVIFKKEMLHSGERSSANCKVVPACLCPRLHNCCGGWEGWDSVNRFNHTSWVAIVTPPDRPKSVRNRSVIEVNGGGVIMLSRCLLYLYVGVGAFVIRLSQISSFLSSYFLTQSKYRIQ